MRPLAEFVMRGKAQATLVAGIAAAIPILFWLSASAASLVLMRKGFQQAMPVIIAALVPAVVWAWIGDPYALLMIGSTLVLAGVLRQSADWLKTLLASIAVGLAVAWILQSAFAEALSTLTTAFIAAMPQVLPELHGQLSDEELLRVQAVLPAVLTGLMAAAVQVMSLLSLMLGRHWQAVLYNPGGFADDFQRVRLPRLLAVMLVVVMFLGPSVSASLGALMPLCAVVMVTAALSLIHGLVRKRQASGFWLVGLYAGVIFLSQFVLPLLVLLALIDSLMDFRGLKASSKDAS